MTFTRVSGTGAIPPPVLTNAAGWWSQTGFAQGSVYQVTPSKIGYAFTPISRTFSWNSTSLHFTGDDHGNAGDNPTPIATDTDVDGVIETGSDQDLFRVAMTAGKRYEIRVTLGTLPDSQLWLYSSGGTQLAYNNNVSATDLSSRIVYDCKTTGNYLIKVKSNLSSQTGKYVLRVNDLGWWGRVTGTVTGAAGTSVLMGFSRVAGTGAVPPAAYSDPATGAWVRDMFYAGTTYRVTPSAPGYIFDPRSREFTAGATNVNFTAYSTTADDHGNTTGTATPVALAGTTVTVAGCLEVGTDVDFFSITLEAGVQYELLTILGTLLDSKLWLYDPNGTQVAYNDDVAAGNKASRIQYTPTVSGVHYVKVGPYSAIYTGTYQLRVSR